MKSAIFATLLICGTEQMSAQRIMKIEKTDGTLTKINTDEIKRVYFDVALCPDTLHPHAIDLGIGIKWACCNVGASSPEKCGDYYAWGETSAKSYYDWSTYIHCDSTYQTCHHIGDDISRTSYDVATQKWDGGWRMPNLEECEALTGCESEWTTYNGMLGRIFTGPNGNRIFLPAAGYMWQGKLCSYEGWGLYWLSTISPELEQSAYSLGFFRGDAYWLTNGRLNGFPIRPVIK